MTTTENDKIRRKNLKNEAFGPFLQIIHNIKYTNTSSVDFKMESGKRLLNDLYKDNKWVVLKAGEKNCNCLTSCTGKFYYYYASTIYTINY